MKIISKIIIITAVFLVGLYIGQQYIAAPEVLSDQLEDNKAMVSLMLDFGNGEIMVFNDLLTKEKTSVFDILEKQATENNLELKYKDYGGGLGVMVESINGIVNNAEPDHFWQYWVNNSYAKVGASNYYLENGDVIEWKYINGQFNN